MKHYFDRRKNQRFLANGGTLILTRKPLFLNFGKTRLIKFGPVINISEGGISTQYISSKKRSEKYNQLSIIMPAEDLKLDNIFFETVWDFQKTEFLKSQTIRQRCIRFHDLTDAQKFQIEYLLENHTTGPVNDRRSNKDRRQTPSTLYLDSGRTTRDRRVTKERRRLI